MNVKIKQQYNREYYLKNRERLIAEHTKWNKDNRERQLEIQKKYREKDLDKFNEGQRKRRAKDPNIKLKYRMYAYRRKLKTETENSDKYIEILNKIAEIKAEIERSK